jgi:hypothetical protein
MASAAVMDRQEYSGEAQEAQEAEEQGVEHFALEDSKSSASSLWRTLMNLRLLLPYVAKLLPLLDGSVAPAFTPPAPVKADLSELHQSFEEVNRAFLDLQAGHKDIRSHVQEQAVQLKRIDEQLVRLRDSTERNTMEHQELVEDLRSASKLVRGVSTAMLILMVAVTAMVAFMLLHARH